MQADTDGKIIVNNAMLRSDVIADLLVHFCKFLMVLRKHRVAVNLKKRRFFPKAAEFVGVEVKGGGNAPAASKFLALVKLIVSPPAVVTDVLGVVGFFGFCQEWIPSFEVRIGPWRGHKKEAPPLNSPEEEQMQCMHSEWTAEDQQKLEESGQEILKQPICERPDCSR